MLTFRFKESAIVTAPTIRHDTTDTRIVGVSSLNSVVSARATVSNTLESPEGRCGKDQMVSTIRILLVAE